MTLKKFEAYISIGSNINPKENIGRCIDLLKSNFEVLAESYHYETKPYGYENQPNFINLAVKIKTKLKPKELLKKLHYIEKKLGRERKIKNMPRTIDLDILLYGSKVINERNLCIPHKGLFERDFMLIPLLNIAPEVINPITKKKIKYLKRRIQHKQIIRKVN